MVLKLWKVRKAVGRRKGLCRVALQKHHKAAPTYTLRKVYSPTAKGAVGKKTVGLGREV